MFVQASMCGVALVLGPGKHVEAVQMVDMCM